MLTGDEQGLLQDLALWAQTEMAVAQGPGRAAQMQRDLLPPQIICLPCFEIAGACAPSRAVGGDFYDWYLTPDGAAFTLVDTAGTGVAAATTAAKVCALLRDEPRHDDINTMAEAIAALLRADLNETSKCTTLFHARLDIQTGRVRYIDAGHGLSLVIHSDDTTDWLVSESLPIDIGAKSSWTE